MENLVWMFSLFRPDFRGKIASSHESHHSNEHQFLAVRPGKYRLKIPSDVLFISELRS